MRTSDLIFLFAAVTVALMAGLFYAYSCSVVPGLAKLIDTEYLNAMQSINRAILNPLFLSCFMGALLLLPLSTVASFRQSGSHPASWLWLVAALSYALGVFGVTMFGNVPMNNVLDKFDIAGSTAALIRQQRLQFEDSWNTLNHVRCVFAVLSLVFAVLACLCRLPVYRSVN